MSNFELRPTLCDQLTKTSITASCIQYLEAENAVILEATGPDSVVRLRVYWPEWTAFVKAVSEQVKFQDQRVERATT